LQAAAVVHLVEAELWAVLALVVQAQEMLEALAQLITGAYQVAVQVALQ
jgi:hypothetical protein